jgi:zinc protease
MRIAVPFLTALSLLFTSASFAKTAVQEFTLNNGLKILVKEDHRAPTASVQIWYKVGAGNEYDGITGVSHVLEHMMFKGTPKNPGNAFFKITSSSGGDQNAFTSYDFTAYFQQLPPEKLATVFELEADRMTNLNLAKEDFVKEIEVVKEERHIRTENNPQGLTYEQFASTAYVAIPYRHPVIGWMSDLNSMTLENVKIWYKAWYAPNNATLVVVGDVNPRDVFNLAKQYFGSIQPSPLPEVKKQEIVEQRGSKVIRVKVPAKLPYLFLGYNVPSINTSENSSDAYALEVLNGVLSGGDSARFSKNLERGAQIATSLDASYDLYARLSNLFVIAGVPTQKSNVAELKRAVLKELIEIQQKGVSEEELERVKAQVIAQHVYQQDSIFFQGYLLGMLQSVGLSWHEIDNYQEQIKQITPEHVQQVALKYFKPERLTIAILEPQQTADPATPANNENGSSEQGEQNA